MREFWRNFTRVLLDEELCVSNMGKNETEIDFVLIRKEYRQSFYEM